MLLSDLINILSDLVPGFDGSGFLSSENSENGEKEISRIGICVDPTPLNIETALKKNIQLLITYHPYYGEAGNQEMLFLPLHEGLDVAPEGINHSFAKALQLQNGNIVDNALIGDFSSVDFRMLIENCQRILDLNILSYYGDLKSKVKRLAIFSGSGFLPQNRQLWQKCLDNGCDTIISGEATIVALRFAATNGLNLIDIGHNGIAGFGLEHFSDVLKVKLASTDCHSEFLRDSYAMNFHTKNYFLQQNDETEESLPLFFFSERFDVE